MTDDKKKPDSERFNQELQELLKAEQGVEPVNFDEDEQTLERLLVEDIDLDDGGIDSFNSFSLEDNDKNLVQDVDEVITPELIALDQVGDLAEFAPEAVQTGPVSSAVVESLIKKAQQVEQTPQIHPQSAANTEQLAGLISQIASLAEQQQIFKQELRRKAGKEALLECEEGLAEVKLAFDQQLRINRQTAPVSGNSANVLAVLALLVAAGFGWQSWSTQTQLTALQAVIDQQQQQLTSLPETADKVSQLDLINNTQQSLTSQLTDLAKQVEEQAKSTADFDKQLTKLNGQVKQLDESVDSLKSRQQSAEKAKPVASLPAPVNQAVVPAPAVANKVESKKPDLANQKWLVNLSGFKHDWYALRKADEYAAKGFPVKISKTQVKGETSYRLVVEGFNSQQDAEAYAAKARKSLNLDSVSVSHN